MRLTSGPANYERFRSLIIVVLFIGWGCLAFYDWQIGYLKKNQVEARKRLSQIMPAEKIPQELPKHPDEDDFERAKKAGPTTLAALKEILGDPLGYDMTPDGDVAYFFVSAYGMVTAPAKGETIDPARLNWTKWYMSKSEVDGQVLWGSIAVLIGLCFVPGMVKAFALRVEIDDEGMTYAGKRIPFSAMKRFDNYSPKGWVDLIYEIDGREAKLRLDDHRVREFNGIIDEICKEKGLPDPRTPATAPA